MRTSDFLVQFWYAEQSMELEAENWRLYSTTLVRGVPRIGDFVVQL